MSKILKPLLITAAILSSCENKKTNTQENNNETLQTEQCFKEKYNAIFKNPKGDKYELSLPENSSIDFHVGDNVSVIDVLKYNNHAIEGDSNILGKPGHRARIDWNKKFIDTSGKKEGDRIPTNYAADIKFVTNTSIEKIIDIDTVQVPVKCPE